MVLQFSADALLAGMLDLIVLKPEITEKSRVTKTTSFD